GERDYRGWEWYYQWRLCHDDFLTINGSPEPPDPLPPSRADAVAGPRPEAPGNLAAGVAFSPDGRQLITLYHESKSAFEKVNKIQFIVANSGRLVRETEDVGSAERMVVSPDGLRIALAYEQGVSLRDATSGKEQTFFSHPRVSGIRFSPDGRR